MYEFIDIDNIKDMIKFQTDPNLGQTVSEMKCWCFGVDPIDRMWALKFAAGGHKFSQLCGFKFRSKAATDYPLFSIAFVSKLRSKIYHQADRNPSQWYIFKKISPSQVDVLGKKELLVNYGFDIDRFFSSDVFNGMLSRFKQTILKGLNDMVPPFIDSLPEMPQKKEAQRYADAIRESLALLGIKRVNDKFYSLHNLYMSEKEEKEVEVKGEFKTKGVTATVDEDEKVNERQWDAIVKPNGSKFDVVEKNGNFWLATFADKASAEAFAKEYPELKAKSIAAAKAAIVEAGIDELKTYQHSALQFGAEVFKQMRKSPEFDERDLDASMLWALFGCAEWILSNSNNKSFKEVAKKISEIGAATMI